MRYHMVVDSGGTKCSALLFDDDYRMLAYTVKGSVRESTTPPELCREHIREIMEDLRTQCPRITSVATLHGALTQSIADMITPYLPADTFYGESETRLGLAAAGIDAPGLLCLSGTGQFASYVAPDRSRPCSMGAYGAIIYDEGSGYHLGRLALSAAIHYEEGAGDYTVLYDDIRERMGTATFREAIFKLGSSDGTSGIITRVASLSRLVSDAANKGDAVAAGILRSVGTVLGQQMNALIRRCGAAENTPVSVAGGVFRGHPLLFDTFCETVRKENPTREIRMPIFEPIVGAVLAHAFDAGEKADAKLLDFFRREYASLLL